MKRILATIAVLGMLTGAACSASVKVEDKPNGANIEGDVDQQK